MTGLTTMRVTTPTVLTAILLCTPLAAQLEEAHLPFLGADEAFAEAARTGKRVLVYQDWPG